MKRPSPARLTYSAAPGHNPLPLRPTWIEVSRSALVNNYRRLRSRLAATTKLMAVVKANAYGHGAAETARILQTAGADAFAVATLQEALELRAAGIERSILVLGYTPAAHTSLALAHSIALTLFDLETAAVMDAIARAQGQTLTVHLKVNTGMNRLGVKPALAPQMAATLRQFDALRLEGIFTHFATADELDKRHAEAQFTRFRRLLEEMERNGLRPPLAHAANSAALLTMPHTHLDMVRPGIALYGLAPDVEQCPLPEGFRPALTWKTTVAQVSDLEPGEAVSYGREFIASRPMRIAALPVGYADGFPRKPQNWGSVLIHGRPAPILGRVCMDQCVVDVTTIEADCGPVRQGDEVILIGRQGEREISAEEAGRRVGTNNYDIVSRILARVPRLYVD
ncbi:MAG: alanine racemase [Caldilinea sp.]|nr:alanine racemase [Caldilinea sp.]MDW8441689.1 alanine racemase [Caldilineaceae bacterium]